MNSIAILMAGEMQRLKKYNILTASFTVALLWIGVLALTEIQDLSMILPLVLFLDATSMAMVLIGVTMFYEKEEGTIKTLLVSPINKVEYILAKTATNIFSNLITLALVYAYARIFREISINLAMLAAAVILISFFHSLVGFVLTYSSRDFTSLLVGMVKYTVVLMVPVILEQVGLIADETVSNLLLALPTKASMVMLNAAAHTPELWELLLAIGYLVAASAILFVYVVRRFDEYAVKESGV
ncbi:fluoroquinolone export ABC transporter permease subunit [Dethiobacter alkaliphilus]|uniref:ABC-type transport system, permease component n=1 Tax=Dethiobacter alkaliphilus AHT 1 TaxID=555088 RepID=C0GDJ8_DETAL|nr:ABC transporter permease [Dethiobacter alkaliphilus]EEG78719.1 ABC-type transport system, permease component [Dethiobacter alkaliphilus AHT 1]